MKSLNSMQQTILIVYLIYHQLSNLGLSQSNLDLCVDIKKKKKPNPKSRLDFAMGKERGRETFLTFRTILLPTLRGFFKAVAICIHTSS